MRFYPIKQARGVSGYFAEVPDQMGYVYEAPETMGYYGESQEAVGYVYEAPETIADPPPGFVRSEEHTSELQSQR